LLAARINFRRAPGQQFWKDIFPNFAFLRAADERKRALHFTGIVIANKTIFNQIALKVFGFSIKVSLK
jgi:hypothetical protein